MIYSYGKRVNVFIQIIYEFELEVHGYFFINDFDLDAVTYVLKYVQSWFETPVNALQAAMFIEPQSHLLVDYGSHQGYFTLDGF